MDVGTVLSVAQTLFAALQNPELREMGFLCGYKDEIASLQQNVTTVKAVLYDAGNKQDMSEESQLYIEKLKNVVYDADDLLDEFVTLAKKKDFIEMEGCNFSKKVCSFLSCYNNFIVPYNLSCGAKRINKNLDAIASDHNKFGFSKEHDDTIRRERERDETCSHPADKIIGRENDVNKIVNDLLYSDVEQNDIQFLSITGIGGQGKTALAQLVYNDNRIENAFQMKLWACVSDYGEERLNFTKILGKILESATGKKQHSFSLEHLQQRLRARLTGRRFLLVLDDVWNESRDEWIKLAGYLTEGRRGSWVLVTTRSQETARAIGTGRKYELMGLAKEDSWILFQEMAFGHGNTPSDLVEIGQRILKWCANNPLAIRVVGSSLHGQRKAKWTLFQEKGLSAIASGNYNGIMTMLKLSYDLLKFPLRSCFSYCAIFPKDFEIDKEILIGLWMAQGYIIPLVSDHSIDDVAEDYFLALLHRCFFQDVTRDEYGEVVSCKVHDLMHDIAQQVSVKEICSNPKTISRKVRHLAVGERKFTGNFSFGTNIRTFLQVSKVGGMLLIDNILANCPRLRTLDLRGSEFEILPSSIAKLLHLRYLDLSYNVKLKVLPKSITELHNLQTLNLLGCKAFKVLPIDLSKLVNLRVLDVKDCYLPLYMPRNFGKLTNLQKLDRFSMGNPRFDQMEDLKALINLKGSLGIQLSVAQNATYESTGGAYMSTLKNLNAIEIWYLRHECYSYESVEYEEALLEDLQPHPNLKYLRLVEYHGGTMPSWARKDNLASFLPNLVRLEFNHCLGVQYLPYLGKLRHLKSIGLEVLPNLEYVTNDIPDSGLSLFPCLEQLFLSDLPKLKGWWPSSRAGVNSTHLSAPCLPQLKGLWLYLCPNMPPNLQCPLVEDLRVADANRSLELKIRDADMYLTGNLNSTSPRPSSLQSASYPQQMRVTTGNVDLLRLVPVENFQCLVEMRMESDNKLKSFSEVEGLFQSCLSSLRVLEIWRCLNLTCLSGGLEHLTALERLHIRRAPGLLLHAAPEEPGTDVVPWHSLGSKLRSLKLQDLSQLVYLPLGMQHLTSLESLSISDCKELQSLPRWMRELTSLKRLEVRHCSEKLKARCGNPTGEDWPNIQHITDIVIEE